MTGAGAAPRGATTRRLHRFQALNWRRNKSPTAAQPQRLRCIEARRSAARPLSP